MTLNLQTERAAVYPYLTGDISINELPPALPGASYRSHCWIGRRLLGGPYLLYFPDNSWPRDLTLLTSMWTKCQLPVQQPQVVTWHCQQNPCVLPIRSWRSYIWQGNKSSHETSPYPFLVNWHCCPTIAKQDEDIPGYQHCFWGMAFFSNNYVSAVEQLEVIHYNNYFDFSIMYILRDSLILICMC